MSHEKLYSLSIVLRRFISYYFISKHKSPTNFIMKAVIALLALVAVASAHLVPVNTVYTTSVVKPVVHTPVVQTVPQYQYVYTPTVQNKYVYPVAPVQNKVLSYPYYTQGAYTYGSVPAYYYNKPYYYV